MKVEELRVGNFVQTLKSNFFDGDVLDWSLDMFYWVAECVYSIEDFKPIPLTEEVLLDCGFEFIDGFMTLKMDNESGAIFVFYHGNILRLFCRSGFMLSHNSLKHVHQLQNLYFALTGQELEFKTLGK